MVNNNNLNNSIASIVENNLNNKKRGVGAGAGEDEMEL
jgi:hypothetical protein